MNKHVLNYSCVKDTHKLPFEYFTFMKIVSNNLDFTPFMDSCLNLRFRQLRQHGHNLFIRNRYEDVLIALAKFCYETEFPNDMLDVHDFTIDLYGADAPKHDRAIHSLYIEFYDIFEVIQPSSGNTI